MEPFQYEPLDLGIRSFRLLILYPGDDDIRCDIFQAVLEPDDIIPYEALSYAWGGIDRTETITASGKWLPVTERLFTALVHLRTNETRILWVDAICIDQDNIAERGHQVGQMAGIYRQAEQVLIWLGPGTPDTVLLMQGLRVLHHDSIRQKSRDDIAWARTRWQCLQMDKGFSALARDSFPRGLLHMLQQAWFTRIWVLQEVSYARVASICCGDFSVPAYIFVLATQLIKNEDNAIFELGDQRQTLLDLMPRPSSEKITRKKSLHTLLQKFCESEATDPRDMVYALLGIASDTPKDANNTPLVPDYFKTETTLIRDLLWYLSCGNFVQHEILDTDLRLRAFLKTIPAVTDASFKSCIVKGNLDGIKELLARGQSFEITRKAISALGSRVGIVLTDPRLPDDTLWGLLRLRDSSLTFSSDGIVAALDCRHVRFKNIGSSSEPDRDRRDIPGPQRT
ncbi:HET domain-containing protein [Colletotrichum abscissum]|uniref:HET domain-containing protein n=1 Tax=Colletotrichum abscissum TaxID=1671311 RepID=UPI0027D518DC|nr:HET domain-containing protein [Colletotrichum abscissum]KAK1475439.1 HET domain-containing protein [Colletotrichum abscissum]